MAAQNKDFQAIRESKEYKELVNDLYIETTVGGDRFDTGDIAFVMAMMGISKDNLSELHKDVMAMFPDDAPDELKSFSDNALTNVWLRPNNLDCGYAELGFYKNNKDGIEPDNILKISDKVFCAFCNNPGVHILISPEGRMMKTPVQEDGESYFLTVEADEYHGRKISPGYRIEGGILSGKTLVGDIPFQLDIRTGMLVEAKKLDRKEEVHIGVTDSKTERDAGITVFSQELKAIASDLADNIHQSVILDEAPVEVPFEVTISLHAAGLRPEQVPEFRQYICSLQPLSYPHDVELVVQKDEYESSIGKRVKTCIPDNIVEKGEFLSNFLSTHKSKDIPFAWVFQLGNNLWGCFDVELVDVGSVIVFDGKGARLHEGDILISRPEYGYSVDTEGILTTATGHVTTADPNGAGIVEDGLFVADTNTGESRYFHGGEELAAIIKRTHEDGTYRKFVDEACASLRAGDGMEMSALEQVHKNAIPAAVDGLRVISRNGMQQLVNEDGEERSPLYVKLEEESFRTYCATNEDGKHNLVVPPGAELLPLWVDDIGPESEGYRWVSNDGLFNHVRMKTGELLSPDWASEARDFHDGWAVIKAGPADGPDLQGKYNYISTGGGIMSEDWFDKASDFRQGRAVVSFNGEMLRIDTGKNVIQRIAEAYSRDEEIEKGMSR